MGPDIFFVLELLWQFLNGKGARGLLQKLALSHILANLMPDLPETHMGTTFPLGSDLEWFEQIVDLSTDFFGKLVEGGESQLAEVKAKWPTVQASGDQDHLEHLADVGGEASDFVDEASDVALVAMYHWVERSMKNILSRVLRGLGRSDTNIRGMDAQSLRQKFSASARVKFETLSHDQTVNSLRIFANSWKHNADLVADNLCRDLGLPVPSTYRSYLAEVAIREAMGAKVNLAAGCEAGTVVREYALAAATFIKALANACP
jgi:hypothetical protein